MDRSAEDFSRPCLRGLLAVVVKHAGAQQISERGVQLDIMSLIGIEPLRVASDESAAPVDDCPIYEKMTVV
jgi:hypothetical protein